MTLLVYNTVLELTAPPGVAVVCVCECVCARPRVCVCVFMHHLKPAVYHSYLPCVTSKSSHARFRLFMTQSQEGHMCLCWALCHKTWTYITKNTAHLHTVSVFFFQGYHVSTFSQRDLDLRGLQRNLSGPGQGRPSCVPCVLHTSNNSDNRALKTVLP